MLTGKDVYEATLFATSDIAGKWDKLSTFDKHVYEVAASVLNGTHIAPLQGLVETLQRNEQATFKDALSIIGDTVTDSVTIINDLQSQITTLKSLVKDYHSALVDAHERKLNVANAFSLEKRMRVLLEEPKS